jgi:tetratricopeptide (TPR) repeat protein
MLVSKWTGAFALALCATPAFAEGARERGTTLAREGRCEAALGELAQARAAAPSDVEVLRLIGLCELRLHRYAEASSTLAEARAAAPERADLALALAMARFHAGDYAGSEQALAGAAALENDAEYQLYLGMLRLQAGDNTAAVAALERARSLDAARVDPVASYYLGIALAQDRDTPRAREMLLGVRDNWSGSAWGSEASRALAKLEQGDARMAFASIGAGFEYDDNAVLRGRGVPLPSDISDESDWLGVWTASAGAEVWKQGDTVLGLMGSYRGRTYVDLQDFDSHFPGATLWLDTPLGQSTRGRLRYDFGYAWQRGDPFLATNGLQASAEHAWPRFGSTDFYVQGSADEYFFRSDDVPAGDGVPGSACPPDVVDEPCGPPGLNERRERDRDGFGWGVGFDHSVPVGTGPLPLSDTQLLGGFRYAGFAADGREYDFDAYDFHGGVGTTLPAALDLDVIAGFTLRPYRHSTTFPDPNDLVDGVEYSLPNTRKREKTTRVEVALARAFGERVVVGAYWRYLDNQSTADVFDYDQYVAGMNFTLNFSKEL